MHDRTWVGSSRFGGSRARVISWAIAAAVLATPARAQTSVTINTDQQRAIEGITQLDREKYFNYHGTFVFQTNTNLGNLVEQVGSPTGLNLTSGRISTELDQFISSSLPEDPSRPGFIDPVALRNRLRGDYRDFVLNGSRWQPIRTADNPLIVQSGRTTTFWPSFMRLRDSGLPRVDAYAEFLSIYLEEVHFGPNAFLPIAPDRFHLELVNEPDLHIGNGNDEFTLREYIAFHRDVTAKVKAVHPNASIGGPSLAVTSVESNNFGRFEDNLGTLIAQTDLDYYSIHPYERYDVQSDGSVIRAVDQGLGRIDATLDLIRSRDRAVNGELKPIAMTEYGSFNRTNLANGSYGNYARDEQQWDLSRDIREQLLLYLDRPDAVLNTTPFVAPHSYLPGTPTPAEADNVFWEQDASGNWNETILASMFRAYAPVSGSYLALTNDNSGDLQAIAFRDGDKVYVLLNNLRTNNQNIDLSVLTALGGVASASIDRLYRQNGQNNFIDDVDVTSSFQSLVLNGQEGAVLTLTLTDDTEFGSATNRRTFYSDLTIGALTQPIGRSPVFGIDAEIDHDTVLSAVLRVGYNRPEDFTGGEGFDVIVNGTRLSIPTGVLGIDDGDFGIQSRLLDIDPALLFDGANTFQIDFTGNGGFLTSAALIVTSAVADPVPLIGDYNGDGLVSQADLDLVLLNWSDTALPTGFDASLLPGGGPFDGLIGQNELAGVLVNWGSSTPPILGSLDTVPEPASAAALVLLWSVTSRVRWRHVTPTV